MEVREGLSPGGAGGMGGWVKRGLENLDKAHLLGQVDFEGRVHDARQQISQDVPHNILSLL